MISNKKTLKIFNFYKKLYNFKTIIQIKNRTEHSFFTPSKNQITFNKKGFLPSFMYKVKLKSAILTSVIGEIKFDNRIDYSIYTLLHEIKHAIDWKRIKKQMKIEFETFSNTLLNEALKPIPYEKRAIEFGLKELKNKRWR